MAEHLVVALSALFVLTNIVAWRPLSRRRLVGSMISWMLGWQTAEFPLVAAVVQLATLGAVCAAAWLPSGPPRLIDLVSLGVVALSWAILVDLARVAHHTAEQLGHGRVGSFWSGLGARRRWTDGRPLKYGPAAENLLVLWRRPDLPATGLAPIILQIPGGAWVTGSRRLQGYPLLDHLTRSGWICAAIDHRLSPRHPWPAHIVDVKRAISWLRNHADEFGGDPNRIVVTGGSSGGHLSALAALTANDPAFQPGFESDDTSVAAAVSLYPFTDWTDYGGLGHRSGLGHLERSVVQRSLSSARSAFEQASPTSRVSALAPAFFVAHGTNDSFIPIEQTDRFVAELRAVSAKPVVYARLPRAQHAFDLLGSPRTRAVVAAIADFLEPIRRPGDRTQD